MWIIWGRFGDKRSVFARPAVQKRQKGEPRKTAAPILQPMLFHTSNSRRQNAPNRIHAGGVHLRRSADTTQKTLDHPSLQPDRLKKSQLVNKNSQFPLPCLKPHVFLPGHTVNGPGNRFSPGQFNHQVADGHRREVRLKAAAGVIDQVHIVHRAVPTDGVRCLHHLRQIPCHALDSENMLQKVRHEVAHVREPKVIIIRARFPGDIDTAAFSEFIDRKCRVVRDIRGVGILRRRMPVGRNETHVLLHTRFILRITVDVVEINPVRIRKPRELAPAVPDLKVGGNVVAAHIPMSFR